MKISSKRLVALALVAMMAVTFMLPQAYADPKGKAVPPGHSKGKAYWKIGFADVDEDLTLEWAWQAIDKMYSKGIIIGYGNGIFKPKNHVTHLESIIMAMRVMGWEEEAKSKKLVPGDISSIKVSWDDAYYYIAMAVEKGIVKPEEVRNFKPDVPAKRYEVARYITRALGKEKEAQKNMDRKLPFKDANAIPRDAIGYVYVISDMGLMIGDNNNLFKPNNPITRAEMAMLLTRLDDAVEEERGNKLEGTVVAADEDNETITIENSYGKVRYYVKPGAPVYIGGKYRVFEDINIGDEVELVLNDKKEVVFIQVVSASKRVITTSQGLVTEVNTKDSSLALYTALKDLKDAFVGTVRVSRVEGLHFELVTAEGTYVLEGSLRDIEDYIGKKIVVVGKIKADSSIYMRGDLLEVKNFYQIKDKDVITVKVDRNTKITVDGKSQNLSRIESGYHAQVKAEGDKAIEIKAETPERYRVKITEAEGLVTEVNTKEGILNLYTALGDPKDAFVGTVRLSRIEGLHFELDTAEGTYVLGGSIKDIENHIGQKIVVVGELTSEDSIYMRGDTLEVKNFYPIKDKDVISFKVDKNTEITVGGKSASLSRIDVGHFAQVKAEGDKAIEVKAESIDHKRVEVATVKGLVTEIDAKNNTLSLYTAAKAYEKTFIGTVRLSRIEGMHFELETDEGRYVLMGIVNDGDSDIEEYIGKKIVITGKITEGMSIYMRGPLLEVEKFSLLNAKDIVTLRTDRNTKVTLDGKGAKLTDLKADQVAEVKTRADLALEVTAKSVEKATFTPKEPEAKKDEEVEGKIVAISNKQITVKNDDGEFTFNLGSKVKLEGVKRLAELKVGAKVELRIWEGKVAEIELD